jgi:hypothetical protein
MKNPSTKIFIFFKDIFLIVNSRRNVFHFINIVME